MKKDLTFAEALTLLNEGKPISRKKWSEEGAFIFKQVPSTIVGKETIKSLKSVPESVKDLILFKDSIQPVIYYSDQYCIVKGNVINSWLPNAEDINAKDWKDISIKK